jgi:hypothetical protein
MIIAFRKRTPGVFSSLIRLWTRSKYDHCELLLSGRTLVGATSVDGVRIKILEEDLPTGLWDVLDIPITPVQDALIYQWATGEVGCHYDWLGIFFCQVLPIGRQSNDEWFCSEFCSAAVQQIGLLQGVKPYKQSPGKLYHLLTGVRK